MKRIIAAVTALIALTAFAGCSKTKERKTVTGLYFDTVVTVTAYGADDSLMSEALEMCAKYEKLFSRTDAESEIYRLNENKSAELSGETAYLLGLSKELTELTGGAFDVTIGGVNELWDFEKEIIPDENDVSERLKSVGSENIILSGTHAELENGASADLGGIAKGYIADSLEELFRKNGIDAIINVGGDISATDGREWKIGIKNPEKTDENVCIINTDKSVVTSGTYERCFTVGGVKYHHILDPETGCPAQTDALSATVICESAAEADALSTACIVLGSEKAIELIEKTDGAEAVIITENGMLFTEGAEAMIHE